MSARQQKTRGPGRQPEATLFHQAQNGNRRVLNHLMARHDGLVHAVIRRHGSESLSYAETLQAGRIGLWHAILKFDPCRGLAQHYAPHLASRQNRPHPSSPSTPLGFAIARSDDRPGSLIRKPSSAPGCPCLGATLGPTVATNDCGALRIR